MRFVKIYYILKFVDQRFYSLTLGSRKKVLFLVARPLRMGGGSVEGCAPQEKRKNMALFAQKLWRKYFWSKSVPGYFKTEKKKKKKFLWPLSRGGKVKALVAGPLIKDYFFAASQSNMNCFRKL